MSAVGDVDGDQKGDLLIGNPQAVTVEAGNLDFDQVKLCSCLDTPCSTTVPPAFMEYGHQLFCRKRRNEVGPVAGVGDLNGDDKSDFIIGAPEAEGPNEEGGVSCLFLEVNETPAGPNPAGVVAPGLQQATAQPPLPLLRCACVALFLIFENRFNCG